MKNTFDNLYLGKPIFICGAPRSGTTLLHDLLSSHPNLSSISIENHIPDNYLRLKSKYNFNLCDFFSRDYIYNFDVRMIWDLDYYNYLEERSLVRFKGNKVSQKPPGIESDLKSSFIKIYSSFFDDINYQNFSISDPIRALAKAYTLSFFQNKTNLDGFLHRRNIFNEFLALNYSSIFPESKFIHIIRDPLTRYASSKKRNNSFPRHKISYGNKNYVTDFLSNNSIISMLSLELAKRNKLILGSRYIIVKYEDLVENPNKVTKNLLNNLNISFENISLSQERYGKKVEPNSSFANSKPWKVSKYTNNLSTTEKYILSYYCAWISNSFGYQSLEPVKKYDWKKTLTKIPKEPLSHYFKNRKIYRKTGMKNYIYWHNQLINKYFEILSHGTELPI